MQTKKVLRRITRTQERPELLNRVARDVGVALARGQRDELAAVLRQLAIHAPGPGDQRNGNGNGNGNGNPDADGASGGAEAEYWPGFAAALATVLTSYEAAHQEQDARDFARRVVAGASAESVVMTLAEKPATGAELARALGLTPGAVSKVLKSLRRAGLARVAGGAGGNPIPERGARKLHRLTPLGLSISAELGAEADSGRERREAAIR